MRYICPKCRTQLDELPASERCPEDGAQVIEDLTDTLLVDRYHIDELIGIGGMKAPVWKATQTSTRRTVAIKLLHEVEGRPASRFEREACIAAALNHRHTTIVHDYGMTDDGKLFLIMEYLIGRSLRDALLSPEGLPIDRGLHIADQLLRGLEHAHSRGVVHRDLKPDNVFLVKQDDDEDFVKILDFGIAKYYEVDPDADEESLDPEYRQLTQESVLCGTPLYMAPEQITGARIDHRVDIYACGLVMYNIATGRLPFVAKKRHDILRAQLVQEPPPFAEIAPHRAFPPGLEELVQKALRKNREERFQSTKEMRQALREVRRAAGAATITSDTMDATSQTIDKAVLLDDRWLVREAAAEQQQAGLPPDSLPGATDPMGAVSQSSIHGELSSSSGELAVSAVDVLPQATQTDAGSPGKRSRKGSFLSATIAALVGGGAAVAAVLAIVAGGSNEEPAAANAVAQAAGAVQEEASKAASDENKKPTDEEPAATKPEPAAEEASAAAEDAEDPAAKAEETTPGEASPVVAAEAPPEGPPAPKLVSYKLTVTPEGADITIDGKEVGQAPLELFLERKAHKVEISAEGFEDAQHEIDLSMAPPGSVVTKSIELEKVVVAKAKKKITTKSKKKSTAKAKKTDTKAEDAKPKTADAKPKKKPKKPKIPLLGGGNKPGSKIEVLK